MEIPAAGRRADLAVDFPALVETAAVTVALADVGTDAMAVDLETAAVLVTEAALETEVVSEMALVRAVAIRAKEKTSMQTYRSHSMRRPSAATSGLH